MRPYAAVSDTVTHQSQNLNQEVRRHMLEIIVERGVTRDRGVLARLAISSCVIFSRNVTLLLIRNRHKRACEPWTQQGVKNS